MESEMKKLLKVWSTVFASLTFCHLIIRKVPNGKMRLISLLPIISLFILLPLNLSSVYGVSITTFFITWLANFKLLLFAFDKGPLSSYPSFLPFMSIACLPIKIKHVPHPTLEQNGKTNKSKEIPEHKMVAKVPKSPLNYPIKVLLLALVLYLYNYKEYMNQYFATLHLCCHVYFAAEVLLALIVAPVRAILGLEIDPQFDEPYLSTSLQDFWGRRWNLMASSILGATIHKPLRQLLTPILGRKWALLPAVITTFLVSGLIHELLYYYASRVDPTWEVTLFFVVHGVCTALEITVKMALGGRWSLHPAISGPLTIGFMVITSSWLFFPQMLRDGFVDKGVDESHAILEFVKGEVLKPLRLI